VLGLVVPPKRETDLPNLNLAKMRIDIRFFGELVSSGIFTLKEGLPVLGNVLTLIATNDKENHNHLNILLTFCRHCGDDYASLVSRKMQLLAEKYNSDLPKSDFLLPDRQKGLRNLLKDYYKSLASHVVREHKTIKNQEKQNRKILISKGELSDKRKEKFEQSNIAFQKLWTSTQQMADLLDEDLPDLPAELDSNEDLSENVAITLDVSNRFKVVSEVSLTWLC